MSISLDQTADAREAFDRIAAAMRPKLHRYCARMTGSVIDGEDVLQEALVKAMEALPRTGAIDNLEGWLFRIAHNAALDFLRRRSRHEAVRANEDPDMIVDPDSEQDRAIVAASLRTFMRLPVAQRGSVILMDVLGYSLDEIGDIMDLTIPAVKAALHRGRTRLRQLAQEPDNAPRPIMADADRARLAAYVDRFNARDFDAVRAMLAEDVRLDLVAKLRLNGRGEVGNYFHNYARIKDWQLAAGFVDGHPAALVRNPDDPSSAPYFVLLDWFGGRLVRIRDFRFARYATEGADLVMIE